MALNIEDGDWIPLWRKIRKHWLWEDADDLRAWVDILMMANHRDSVFRFRGHLHPMRRGQVAMTYKALAERNGWSRNRVRTFLARLEAEGALLVHPRTFDTESDTWKDTKSDTGFLLLTIVNYPLRKGEAPDRTPERTPKRPATGQRLDSDWTATGHIQEGKERREGEEGGESTPPAAGADGGEPGGSAPLPPGADGGEGPGSGPESPPVAPVAPSGPPAGTGGELGGDDPFAADVAAFAAFTRPGDAHKLDAFRDLVRQGVTHERIRQAARDWSGWDFYAVVKALQNGRPSNGNGRHVEPYRPPEASAAPPADVLRRRQAAQAEVDAKLAALDDGTRATWMREAEERARADRVPEPVFGAAVKIALRTRAAREFGIEGL